MHTPVHRPPYDEVSRVSTTCLGLKPCRWSVARLASVSYAPVTSRCARECDSGDKAHARGFGALPKRSMRLLVLKSPERAVRGDLDRARPFAAPGTAALVPTDRKRVRGALKASFPSRASDPRSLLTPRGPLAPPRARQRSAPRPLPPPGAMFGALFGGASRRDRRDAVLLQGAHLAPVHTAPSLLWLAVCGAD